MASAPAAVVDNEDKAHIVGMESGEKAGSNFME